MAPAFVQPSSSSSVDLKSARLSVEIASTTLSVDINKLINTSSSVAIRQASSPADLAAILQIFKVYAAWLNVDLTYQNHADELKGLPGKYASPAGALLLAVDATTDAPLGCVALRPLELQPEYCSSHPANTQFCEIKRLFVYPEARGRQVGRALVREAMRRAGSAGYGQILLDSLSRMTSAIEMYKSEGFVEIEPYYWSPLEGAIYFAKDLGSDGHHDK